MRHRDTRSRRAGTIAGALLLAVVALVWSVPSAASATTDPATGAVIAALPSDAVVLHVDGAVVLETWPDGSASDPFPTITWAIAHAQELRKNGYAVHVLVAPGTYRETVTVGSAGSNPPPLVIESVVPGAAVVTGADVEDDWTPVAGTELSTAPWPHKWGLTPLPAGWEGVGVPDGVRRREAVLLDGTPMVQVLSAAELVPNSFLVDEDAEELIVHPPSGVDLESHLVEVAQRHHVLRIKGLARAVTVKGFVFEAGAAPFEKHMAYVTDSTDILIEGNTFRHSSWGGLGLCCAARITVRDNRAADNGGNGIDSYKTRDLVVEGNTITGSNVRGARHGYVGWSVAGSKNLLLHEAVFRNNTYEANHARGLWFDTDVKQVLVDGERSCENLRDGVFVEAVQGPLTIRDTTYCRNGGAGVLVATSGNVVLERSTLTDNRYGQLVFAGDRVRSWSDHRTGESITMGDFEHLTLTANVFLSTGTARLVYSPVIPIEDWRALLAAGEIVADENYWSRPSMEDAMRIQATNYPMSEWLLHTGDSPMISESTTTTSTTTTTTSTTAPGKGRPKSDSGTVVRGRTQ